MKIHIMWRKVYDCAGHDNENRKEEKQDMEANYFATRAGDGKIMFTCKMCEASFASQKSVVQHNTAKHKGQGTSPSLVSEDNVKTTRS